MTRIIISIALLLCALAVALLAPKSVPLDAVGIVLALASMCTLFWKGRRQ